MLKPCQRPGCKHEAKAGGYCWYDQGYRTDKKPKSAKPRKPVSKISKKLSKDLRTYSQLRKEFLERPENMFCAVYPSIPATQIHHMRGRGKFLNDTSTWLGVSDVGHKWIEANPKLARERGFTKSRLSMTDELNEQT